MKVSVYGDTDGERDRLIEQRYFPDEAAYDNGNGTPQRTVSFEYDAYGNLLEGAGLTTADDAKTDHLYTGEVFDAKTQMQYLRQRWYDPAIGRFNRLDPFEGNTQDPQSLHKYLYAHANPVANIDPDGEFFLTGAITSMSIGQRVQLAYDAQVLAAGDAMTATIFGVQMGMTTNQTIALFLAGTALGVGIGVVAKRIARRLFRPRRLSSRRLTVDNRQLQKFFTKHGSDFGLTGHWNSQQARRASQAINQHVNGPHTLAISGRYRGDNVVHYLDPNTRLNIIATPNDAFISGWRLSEQQLRSVTNTGRLF